MPSPCVPSTGAATKAPKSRRRRSRSSQPRSGGRIGSPVAKTGVRGEKSLPLPRARRAGVLHVVAPQHAPIAYVHLAVRNDRVRPRLRPAAGDVFGRGEPAEFLVFAGAGLDERDVAVLSMDI